MTVIFVFAQALQLFKFIYAQDLWISIVGEKVKKIQLFCDY